MASGVIEGITSKPTVNGTLMYKVTVGGITYGTFDNPGVNIGDDVTFDASKSKDGKYDNAKNFRKGGMLPNGAMTSAYPSHAVAMNPVSAPKAANGQMDPEREARIVRQNATSTAATLVAAIIGANPLREDGSAWDLDSGKAAVFELSKDIFQVNWEGYEAGF